MGISQHHQQITNGGHLWDIIRNLNGYFILKHEANPFLYKWLTFLMAVSDLM